MKDIVFTAKVIAGEGRGQRLGFPTANLDKTDLDLNHGVYLAETEIDNQKYPALMHFGFKETFDEKPSLEVFIPDFSANLYQKEIKVKVIKKIREVKKFKNPEELKQQIEKDLELIKKSL